MKTIFHPLAPPTTKKKALNTPLEDNYGRLLHNGRCTAVGRYIRYYYRFNQLGYPRVTRAVLARIKRLVIRLYTGVFII